MTQRASSAGLFGCLFPSFGMLGMLFLVLKLAQIGLPATWSWWFVLLPFYIIPVGFGIFIIALFFGAWALDQFQKVGTWWRYRARRAGIKKNDAEIAARVKKSAERLSAAEKQLKEEGYISPTSQYKRPRKEDPFG